MARAIHPPRSSRASRSVSKRRLTFGRQPADLAIRTRSAGRARVWGPVAAKIMVSTPRSADALLPKGRIDQGPALERY